MKEDPVPDAETAAPPSRSAPDAPSADLEALVPEVDIAALADDAAEGVASKETASPKDAAPPRRVLSAAWLRAVLDRPLRAHTPAAAWQSLQVRLDDGEGTLTVQTRRSDDTVLVAVGFSDARLQHLASASAERIQSVLQEHFGASVDLSLTGGDADDPPQHEHADAPAPLSLAAPTASADADTADLSSSPRPRLGDGRHEWVG